MDITKIKKLILSVEDRSSIYLLEAITDKAGFFTSEGKLLYIVKDYYDYSSAEIETDCLKLHTHVRINSVKNNQTFEDDYYNVIVYNDILEGENVASFLKLCSIHAVNSSELGFKEFFYSLIDLFQLPSEQSHKNAIGLYGELKVMEQVHKKYKVDLSNSWHKRGSFSKYDFSNGELSLEIKTTSSDKQEITIKHNQIFEETICYLVVVVCEESDSGETINELIREMRKEQDAFNGINYGINLARELKRVSSKDASELHFTLREIEFFDSNIINPFKAIPDNVKGLNYCLDVSELESLEEGNISELLGKF